MAPEPSRLWMSSPPLAAAPYDQSVMWAVVVVCAVVGLLVGSFLNVVIWRVPRGESIVSPPSACPKCGHRLRPYDNVPVVSWLVLRARCRDCGEHISARYPIVESITGLSFVVMALLVPMAALPGYLWLAAAGIALAAIDIDTKRLPNAIVYPTTAVVSLWLIGAALFTGDPSQALRALLGGLALMAFYLVLVLVYPAGMGVGDVKLAFVLGLSMAWLSWGALAVGAFAAFALGAMYGIGLMVASGAGRKTAVPFGPFMVGGTFVGISLGGTLSHWYAGLF